MKTFQELLIELNACEDAREWACDKTIEQVVQECHQGDWLLWLAKRVGVELQPLTLAKGHCANTIRHLMTDERSLKAVDTAIDFGEGKATKEELYKAAAATYTYAAAAYAADAADAAAAAAAAAYAADAAAAAAAAAYAAAADVDAAYTADASADATYDAASADAAAADAARKANQLQTADICRKYIGGLIVKNVTKMLEAKQ
jgi:hypothetical protein